LIVAVVVVGAIGAGITIAAWQAFVPQLVPPDAMVSAVRLNAMQFTGARAFGPALAGLVLARMATPLAWATIAVYVAAMVLYALAAARAITPEPEPVPATVGGPGEADSPPRVAGVAQLDPQPMQTGDVAETFADISAIKRDHGFKPSTTIDEGVPRFVAWYRDFYGV